MRSVAAVVSAIALTAACSLENAGQSKGDAGRDTGATCLATGPCVSALPAGFQPLLVARGNALDCPPNDPGRTYSEHATLGPGACTCDCAVTTPPTCDMGAIHREFGLGSDSSCGGDGFTVTLNGCTARGAMGPLAAWGKVNVLPPVGGACTATPVADPSKVAADALKTCSGATCAETVCEGDAPPGFRACVVGPTGASCPAAFPDSHPVFDAATVECAGCSCQLVSPKCEDAKVDWYSDSTCSSLVGTSMATGACLKETDPGLTPTHLRYSAKGSASCLALGPVTPTPKLLGEALICCKLP